MELANHEKMELVINTASVGMMVVQNYNHIIQKYMVQKLILKVYPGDSHVHIAFLWPRIVFESLFLFIFFKQAFDTFVNSDG